VPADDTVVAAKLSLLADNSARDMEEIWNEEWRVRMGEAALERVKRRVRPEHFQMFDLAVLQHWPARKVAEALGATLTQVYMARHRVGRLVKQEVRRLEEKVL
jgi:RNA polymerase sigma-70 factor (ECF subfamily)